MLGGGWYSVSHHFCDRLGRPMKRMGDLIPLCNELHQLRPQVSLRGKVDDAQPFALENREPLFDLIQPRTVPRCKMHDKPRMGQQPCPDLFAVMWPRIIANNMDRLDLQRELSVEILQERDEFSLPLTLVALTVDVARARVEGRKQIERPVAFVFVFHLVRTPGYGRARRMEAWPWLYGSFFIHTEDDLVLPQAPGVEGYDVIHAGVELCVTRDFRGEPGMVAPGFELVMLQNTADRLRRDMGDDALTFQVPGEFEAIPVGKRPAAEVRPLARHLDQMDGHLWGKKRAGARVLVCPRGPQYGGGESG